MSQSSNITSEMLVSAREASINCLCSAWSLKDNLAAWDGSEVTFATLKKCHQHDIDLLGQWKEACTKPVLEHISAANAKIWGKMLFDGKGYSTAHEVANYAMEKAASFVRSAIDSARQKVPDGSPREICSEYVSYIARELHGCGDFEALQSETYGIGIEDRINAEHKIAMKSLPPPEWSTIYQLVTIASILGLSTSNTRARNVKNRLNAIGSELLKLKGSGYRVRLDKMDSEMREKFIE